MNKILLILLFLPLFAKAQVTSTIAGAGIINNSVSETRKVQGQPQGQPQGIAPTDCPNGLTKGEITDASKYHSNAIGFYENNGQITDQNYKPNPAVKYLLCSPGFNVQLRQTGFSYDTYTDATDETEEGRSGTLRLGKDEAGLRPVGI